MSFKELAQDGRASEPLRYVVRCSLDDLRSFRWLPCGAHEFLPPRHAKGFIKNCLGDEKPYVGDPRLVEQLHRKPAKQKG